MLADVKIKQWSLFSVSGNIFQYLYSILDWGWGLRCKKNSGGGGGGWMEGEVERGMQTGGLGGGRSGERHADRGG